MNSEQARELFSDALDGELEPDARQALDRALAEDPALAAESAAFQSTVALTKRSFPHGPTPNLLPRIQRRLRVQSGGRYYGERFALRVGRGAIQPWVLAGVVVAVLAALWFALRLLEVFGR
jgi:anti-sigma factor RsiW